MQKVYPAILGIFTMLAVQSCSRRTVPERSPVKTSVKKVNTSGVKGTDSTVEIEAVVMPVKKAPIRRKPLVAVPQTITVNDQFARKSLDGRLYYDLDGRRYWRSNADGKYYLYHKSMQTDKDFKKPN